MRLNWKACPIDDLDSTLSVAVKQKVSLCRRECCLVALSAVFCCSLGPESHRDTVDLKAV